MHCGLQQHSGGYFSHPPLDGIRNSTAVAWSVIVWIKSAIQ